MRDFAYVKPASLAEAAAAWKAGEDASYLAGGHTLLPTLKQRLAAPDKVVDIASLAELRGVRTEGGALVIGAATTHAEVAQSAEAQGHTAALAQLAGGIGDPHVRHRGTIGGSLANNDPAADWPACALALGASVETDARTIEAGDFFQGLFTTALEPGEIIKAVRFPKPDVAGWVKFPNPASRYSLVGVFVARFGKEARVAITGAGADGVFRAAPIEAALAADWSHDSAWNAKVAADDLLSDIHAQADYRAHLISVLAARAVAAAS